MRRFLSIVFVACFLASTTPVALGQDERGQGAPAALGQGPIFTSQQQAIYKNAAIILAMQAVQHVLMQEVAPGQEGRKKLLSEAQRHLHRVMDGMLETQLNRAERLDHQAAIREVDGYFRKFAEEYFDTVGGMEEAR
ncbi:MAG: hypothetical protein OXE53_08180 [Deltaproteobacteria bacterium]|nr:hypothetical protein [Deltaproteobacteria bacterium]